MRAKCHRLQRGIGVDIKHTTIIMAENTHPIIAHAFYCTCRANPRFNIVPCNGVVHVAGNNVVAYICPVEYTGKFRSRAGLTVRKPFASHFSPVIKRIYIIIVNCRNRLHI